MNRSPKASPATGLAWIVMDPRALPRIIRAAAAAGAWVAAAAAPAGDLPVFDFTRGEEVAEWHPTHDVSSVDHAVDGMAITITGDDPFVTGPPRDYPADTPLRMTLRIKPAADGMAQVFHFRDHAGEDRSAAFPVHGGRWNEVRTLLPPLGPGIRLRIDPPGRAGTAIVSGVGFERAKALPEPAWPTSHVTRRPGRAWRAGRRRSR